MILLKYTSYEHYRWIVVLMNWLSVEPLKVDLLFVRLLASAPWCVHRGVSAANPQEISIYFNKYIFGYNKYILAYFWLENKYMLAYLSFIEKVRDFFTEKRL